MLEKLGIFDMAQALARHGATRTSVIAQNVANADTPGYRAQDVANFADTYRADSPSSMRTTRAAHMLSSSESTYEANVDKVYRPDAASPNGNNVTLESEIFAAAEAKSESDKAMAIYRSALGILRTSVSTRS